MLYNNFEFCNVTNAIHFDGCKIVSVLNLTGESELVLFKITLGNEKNVARFKKFFEVLHIITYILIL